MRAEVIASAYSPGNLEAAYLLEAAARLEPMFELGIDDDVALGMATFYLLQVHTIVFDDGFVINGKSDLNQVIGNVEAALIVSSLDRHERSADWWNDQRFAKPASDLDRDVYEDLLVRLKTLPGVKRVE